VTLEPGALVLVVDDNVDTLEPWAYFLRTAGFRVETAADGKQALVKARSALPDVIVMDLAMPGLDGWHVTHQLKADEVTRRIPIIVCTANALPEAKEAALQAGCDGFLAKPVHPTLLLAEIGRVVDLAWRAKALASGIPYELILYVRPGSDVSPETRRILEQLMGELDSSQVQLTVRELPVGSSGAAVDSMGPPPVLLVRREGSPAIRIICDEAQLEHLGQRLREAGLPRRRAD
jgi:two-component system cell cycle response regulator DivK